VKSDRLSESQLNAAHFETIDDIQSVIDAAGSDASICVLPEGPQTIPFIG